MTLLMSGAQPNRGFGLVEIMIAIVLGLLLTVAVLQVFVANNRTYQTGEAVAQVQEATRYLQSQLPRQLRMAGYRGCLSKQDISLVNTLNNASTLTYDFNAGLRGYDNLGATLPTELAAHLTGDPAPLVGTDLLMIQRPDSQPLSIVANNNAAQLFAVEEANNVLAIGDIAIVTDCNKGHIFQVTNITLSGGKANIVHSGVNSVTPGNSISSWDPNNKLNIYGTNAEIMRYGSQTYYLATNAATGRPALYSKLNGGAATVMQDGVYNLQILYGIDTNADRQTDRYVTAGNVSMWTQVLTIKMELLLGSSETGVVNTRQNITFNGSTSSAADTRWYLPTTVTAVLRNRLN